MRRRLMLQVCVSIMFLAFSIPSTVMAGGAPFEKIDVEALIKACAVDTGGSIVTTVVARAAWREVDCLEKTILDQVVIMFDEKIFSREKAQRTLKQLRTSQTDIHREIYNRHRGCLRSLQGCGTMTSLLLPSAVYTLFRSILRTMIHERNGYRIQ